MLRNMARSLLIHERIRTTEHKAKELRGIVERLVTLARTDTVHARRLAYKVLENHQLVARLFNDIAPRFAGQPGGYTRVVKLGLPRAGDCAPMVATLVVGTPLGFLLGYANFPGKRSARLVVETFLSFPTVVIGLIVYAFISRRGPLGELGLLFTVPGMPVPQAWNRNRLKSYRVSKGRSPLAAGGFPCGALCSVPSSYGKTGDGYVSAARDPLLPCQGAGGDAPPVFFALDRGVAGFAGADADHALQVGDEDLAVTDVAGVGRIADEIHGLFGQVVRHDHFQFDLGIELHLVLDAAVGLDMVPVKNRDLAEETTADGLVRLSLPVAVRPALAGWVRRLGLWDGRVLRRTVELDILGSAVWRLLDGRRTAGEVAAALADRYRLAPREAELAVAEFLRLLGRRGAIGVADGKKIRGLRRPGACYIKINIDGGASPT